MTHNLTALAAASNVLHRPIRVRVLADMAPVLLMQIATLLLVALSASTIFSVAWAAAGAFEHILGQ